MLLAQSASAGSSITMIVAYVILFGAIIYFMTIRPQKNSRRQQTRCMQECRLEIAY